MPNANDALRFAPGDEAAILKSGEVQGIETVFRIGPVFIQLADGRTFSTIGGKCLSDPSGGYIMPATDAHRAAIGQRSA